MAYDVFDTDLTNTGLSISIGLKSDKGYSIWTMLAALLVSQAACDGKYFCTYQHPSIVNPMLNIYLNLSEITQTPLRFELSSGETMFYAPCDTMTCPEGFECDATPSTIFICDSSKKCESVALIDTAAFMNSIFALPEDQISVTYSGVLYKRSVIFNYMCDFDIEEDHGVVFDSDHIKGSTYEINLLTKDACFRQIDEKPPVDHMKRVAADQYYVDVDLKVIDKCAPFIVNGKGTTAGQTIHVSPCSTLECPMDKCEGPSDTNVWLCNQSEKSCDSFGTQSKGVRISSAFNHLYGGFLVDFEGDANMKASINLTCNESLQSGELLVHEGFEYKLGAYRIAAESPDVCRVSWAIPTPRPYPVFSPPSFPNKMIYATNGTHSNILDLRKGLKFEVKDMTIVAYSSDYAEATFYFDSSKPLKCPLPGQCVSAEEASAWACYETLEGRRCIPYALDNYGFNSIPTAALEEGIIFSGTGPNGALLTANVLCDSEFFAYPLAMLIPDNEISITLFSPEACVRKQVFPSYPTPLPQPTPEPKDKNVKDVKVVMGANKVNLNKYNGIYNNITLLVPNTTQLVDLQADFGKLTPCPSDSYCENQLLASIWKCWSGIQYNRTCVAVGDLRYPPVIKDKTVTIEGGYAGYKTVINLKKDDTVPTGVAKLDFAGTENDRVININLYSSDFYEKALSSNVYLIVTLVSVCISAFVAYFAIGSLYVLKTTGVCDIPNREFWMCCFPNMKRKLPPEVRMSLLQLDNFDQEAIPIQ